VHTYGGYGRCPDGGSHEANNYTSSCTAGTCWSSTAFFLSQSAAPLGYPTYQYACAAPATTSTKVTTEWHPTERLPKRIAEPKRRTTNAYHGEAGVSCAPAGASTALLCSRTVQATTDTTGNSGFSATLTGSPRTWSFTYNAGGQLLTADGPRTDVADVTTWAYHLADDPGGNFRVGDLASITNALGQATSFTHYDAAGRLKRAVDANGLATELDYWPRGWLKSRRIVKAPSIDETTLYDYTAAGDLAKVTRPDGSWTGFGYDDARRLVSVTDNLGNSITYVLDAIGNRRQEQVRDPGGVLRELRQREFNAMNRLWKEIGAAGQTTTFQHDVMGNLRTIAAPASLARPLATQSFDALGRLVQTIDPDGGVVKREFDGLDQLTKVTDPRNLATTYTVDGLGNQSALTSPDTGITTNTLFDEAGNLRQSTDARGKTVTQTFDALNRLTSSTWAGESVTYTHDQGANGIGRLTGIADATGATQYTFDAAGRVLTDTRTLGSVVLATSYGWDAHGRLASITYPSGKVVSYTFDAAGRVSGASVTAGTTTQVVSSATYHPFGTLTGFTFGSGGMSYARTIDQDGRIAAYTLGTTTYNLSFDDAGNITRISDPANTALDKVFGYDRIDRLLSLATNPTPLNQSFTYDKVGNRLTRVLNGTTTNYTLATTSNRLTAVGGVSRTHDAAGNQTADGTSSFTYSDRGRMTGATTPLGSVTYAVNALGQRVRKTVGTVSTHYAFDLEGRLLGEYDGTGSPIQESVWLGSTPVATIRPDGGAYQVFHVWADHLDTPRLVTDSAGQVRWEWANTDPFGANLPNENPAGLGTFAFNLRFPGQLFDAETGTHYNMARDYDPAIGRYVESDPIGLRGGINTFVYAESNPIALADPFGECPWCIGAAAGAITDIVTQLAFNNFDPSCISWTDVGIAAATGAAGVGLAQRLAKVSTVFRGPNRPTFRFFQRKGLVRAESHPISNGSPDWYSYPHWHPDFLPKPFNKLHLPIVEPFIGAGAAGRELLSCDQTRCKK